MRTIFTRSIIRFFIGTLFSLIIAIPGGFAQDMLHVDWESKLTNANGASEKKLKQTEAMDGSAYVAGYSSTPNGQRMYVARYSSAGSVDWEVTLPSESGSAINRLVIVNGNLYVAGSEQIGNSGSYIIHYAKLTSNGELLWHYTF